MHRRLVGLLLVLLAAHGSAASAQQTRDIPSRALYQGTSEPLARLALHAAPATQAETISGLRSITLWRDEASKPMRVAQFKPPPGDLGPVPANAEECSIEGITGASGRIADTAGVVGDSQFVQLSEARLAVYDKYSGALQLGPVHSNALFGVRDAGTDATACGSGDGGAATIQFDHLAKRWIVARIMWDRANSDTGPYHHCIAVSASADAGGSYRRYVLPLLSADGEALIADDARMAVWPDGYYFTFALFEPGSGRYLGPRACGIDRPALLAGRDGAVHCRDLGPAYGPLSPASLDGYAIAPEGNSPTTLLALDFSEHGTGKQLFMWRFSFSRNTFSEASAIAVAPYSIGCAHALDGACVAQAAPGAPLSALGDRLMPRVGYRNDDGLESLLLNHTVQAGQQLGVRWYELRLSGDAVQLYQQGTHAPDHNSRWMGSMAIDKMGNIALGYMVAGPDTPPGIRTTGRLRSDPHGRMHSETFIVNGSGVPTGPAGQPAVHGAISLDPIDGCTFWYAQHYAAYTGFPAWRSRIARFRFENCS